jgi:hypothetical protein
MPQKRPGQAGKHCAIGSKATMMSLSESKRELDLLKERLTKVSDYL